MSTAYDPTTTHMTRRAVFIATDVSEMVIKGATLAIVTPNSWHIFGRKRAHSFDLVLCPLPEGLKCPIIDVSPVSEKLKERAATLILACNANAINTAELAGGLFQLGAIKK